MPGSVFEAHELWGCGPAWLVDSGEPCSHCGACPVDRGLVVVQDAEDVCAR